MAALFIVIAIGALGVGLIYLIRSMGRRTRAMAFDVARRSTDAQLVAWTVRYHRTSRTAYVCFWFIWSFLAILGICFIASLVLGALVLPGLGFAWMAWKYIGGLWDAHISEAAVRIAKPPQAKTSEDRSASREKVTVIVHEPENTRQRSSPSQSNPIAPPRPLPTGPPPLPTGPPRLVTKSQPGPLPDLPMPHEPKDSRSAVVWLVGLSVIAGLFLIAIIGNNENADRAGAAGATPGSTPSAAQVEFDAQVNASWQRVAIAHPNVAVIGSPLRSYLEKRIAETYKTDPGYFSKPDWPESITKDCYDNGYLDVPQQPPVAIATPTATPYRVAAAASQSRVSRHHGKAVAQSSPAPAPSVAPAAIAQYKAEVNASWMRVASGHPDAGAPGTPLYLYLQKRINEIDKSNPAYFRNPDWPERLTAQCYQEGFRDAPR